jgi:hypothetical protein
MKQLLNLLLTLLLLLFVAIAMHLNSYSTEWIQNDQLTISKEMKLRGKHYVMSVRCINKNVILDPYGSEIDMVEYDGTILKECRGYLVQGLPWNSVKQTLNPAYAWQASTHC